MRLFTVVFLFLYLNDREFSLTQDTPKLVFSSPECVSTRSIADVEWLQGKSFSIEKSHELLAFEEMQF